MSDLFSALTDATRALEAQRYGLDVAGQNIANVNTPGYTRRVVDFSAIAPNTPHDAGRGVRVDGIRAMRDRQIERRLQEETSGAEREAALADFLSVAEVIVGTDGQALDARMTAFFDSLSRLADTPTSSVAREQVLLEGGAVARSFRDTAERFASLQRDADRQVTSTTQEINQLASHIAKLNAAMAGATGNAALNLADQQTVLVKQLSALANVSVVEGPDGSVDIDLAGRTLVVGDVVYGLTTTAAPGDGRISVGLGGADITAQLTGGKIGGLLRARDEFIPGYVQRLDEQAFAFANAVNTIHTAGYDLNGDAGGSFFAFTTAPVGSTGAASALVVDPDVAANGNLVVAAATAVAGDNRAARELAGLRHALLMNGGTATLGDAWGQMVFAVGRDVQSAKAETTLRREIVSQLGSLRDQVSGVSLDEEALQLMKFQRAFEANARFFSVVDQTLQTLMNAVGR